MKAIFAAIGLIVSMLCIAGALGIGEFRLCYGPNGYCEAKQQPADKHTSSGRIAT